MLRNVIVLLFIGGLGNSYAQTLVHYWNFNNVNSEAEQLTPNTTLVGGASFVHTPGPAPSIIQITSNTGQNFTAGMNERNGDPIGAHLRLNNPYGAMLTISLPTTGYQDVVAKFAVRRSSVSAAEQELIEYTTDGSTWVTFTSFTVADVTPEVKTFDFSSIPAADNNPDFKIRITCVQGSGGTTGNHRLDNFTLEGTSTSSDVTAPNVAFLPVSGATFIFTDTKPVLTFNEDIRLISNAAIDNSNIDNVLELRLNDASGALVPFDATISGLAVTITPSAELLYSQVYYVAVKANEVEDLSDNAISTVQSATFTTIVPQTEFQPGDIVPVAYRMSSVGTDDGVAFLTLVDILPGTILTFTDSKYTSNAQPQCTGGLIWTAPASGVSSGTVIVFNLVTPTVSVGTFTGSGFGLSSGGDQVLVYAGSVSNPSFVTALSSNAWTTGTLTSCSGSNSKQPLGLTDGTSSIQFSTKHASGNLANAYYNGPMEGTISELRTYILDTVNWVGTTLNTNPQTWPVWAFPGPPVVTSAKVISENSIRVIFNRDMQNASATDIANYTGISGLTTVTRSNNGNLADTVVLNFSAVFVNGTSYTLTVDNIQDSEGRTMAEPFVFTFVYESIIALDKAHVVGTEGNSVVLRLKIENPSVCSVNLIVQNSGTASSADHGFTTQVVNILANETQKDISIPFTSDGDEEMDEYLFVKVESVAGCSISGSPYFTAYIKDDDREVPVASEEIELSFVSRYTVNNPGNAAGLSEIVSYDPVSKRLFTMSTGLERFDIIDFSTPASPTLVQEVSTSSYGSGITSVAVKNGIVAVSVTGLSSEQDNGSVLFYDTDGNFLKQIEAGDLPDMITFTPDGNTLLAANEGQPSLDYSLDPEGSITIVDLSGGIANLTQTNVTTIDFTSFNANETSLIAAGVRKGKQSSTLSQDLEPEYITVSSDSKTAWITLQENNSVAVLDLETNTITEIRALGTKDFSQFGNGMDVSDKTSEPLICNWPVKGFYMPDAIAAVEIGGTTYLLTANEGDEREYATLNERSSLGSVNLDATAFPEGTILKQDVNLGRFRITNINGNTDADPEFEELYSVGTRSFSIWNSTTGALVYDSGDDFERITSANMLTSSIFNADNANNTFKDRSRAKGPEPEGVTVAKIGNEYFAFIGLERIGGVMVYNITDPQQPYLVDYANTRNNVTFGGDNGPEGVLYLSGQVSPDGNYYVVTANEVSGTLAIYEILNVEDLITSAAEGTTQEGAVVRAFPNPSKDGLFYFNQVVTGSVLDVFGREVHHLSKTTSVDMSAYPAGIYTLITENGVVKLVLE